MLVMIKYFSYIKDEVIKLENLSEIMLKTIFLGILPIYI